MLKTPISLLQRLCQHPDEQHWERFVVLFTPLLSRWGHRLGVPATDTEDLIQEVFSILFRQLPEFRYDPSKSFRAWLWTLFHRQTLAWRKRQKRHFQLSDEQIEALACPDQVAEASEEEYRRVLVERVLGILRRHYPPQIWQIFWAFTVEGLPGVEVAKRFGVTPNAVYLIRGRILARIRQELAELDS